MLVDAFAGIGRIRPPVALPAAHSCRVARARVAADEPGLCGERKNHEEEIR